MPGFSACRHPPTDTSWMAFPSLPTGSCTLTGRAVFGIIPPFVRQNPMTVVEWVKTPGYCQPACFRETQYRTSLSVLSTPRGAEVKGQLSRDRAYVEVIAPFQSRDENDASIRFPPAAGARGVSRAGHARRGQFQTGILWRREIEFEGATNWDRKMSPRETVPLLGSYRGPLVKKSLLVSLSGPLDEIFHFPKVAMPCSTSGSPTVNHRV